MADFQILKEAVAAVIKDNGNNEITGDLMQSTLFAIINTLGTGYQFAGVADAAVIPGTPDAKLFYVAKGPGTYLNFNNLVVNDGELAFFFIPSGYSSWYKLSVPISLTGMVFGGVVNPSSSPSSTDNIFYIASTAGTYANFGGITVASGEIALLSYNGTWQKSSFNVASNEELYETANKLEQRISTIREFLGNQESIVYEDFDFSGLYFNGSSEFVEAATQRFDGIIVKIYAGATYNFSNYVTARRFSTKPVIGASGIQYITTFPYTAGNDGYLLFSVEKANAPFTLTKSIDGFYRDYLKEMEDFAKLKSTVTSIIDQNVTRTSGGRVSRGFYLGHPGERIIFNCSVYSGTDTGRYRLYDTNGTTIGSNALTNWTALGTPSEITIPENGYVWLFCETVVSSTVIYTVYAALTNSIERQVANAVTLTNQLDFQINGSLANVVINKTAYRVSQSLYLGHPGEKVRMKMELLSGIDTGGWGVYGTNEAGTAIDGNVQLVDYRNTQYGQSADFIVPENGYVWLFTESDPNTARSYRVIVSLADCLEIRVEDLENQLFPLAGKVMVCFGDSLTEFRGTTPDHKRYSDWLEEMTGLTIINVGIGGTQIRQRQTPTANPQNELQCYAGLDMVNVVKAAMEQDFTIVEACANKLATISADDNREIIARLKTIDWSKVDYVTVMGGANDWRGNLGNTGNVDSTNINETCGAMNNIIQQICTNYKNIKLLWFTTIIQCVDAPAFSDTVQYEIGDMCSYSGAYYRFVNAHLGAWDANDVVSIPRSDFRIPEYYSDNYVINGKNLRQFCALLESVAFNNHIPVCDLYNGLGWNLYNFSNFFENYDNTHPYKGFEWMADFMKKFIVSH